MSLEKVEALEAIEEDKKFEELGFTRDFGAVDEISAKEIVKKNFEYWRLPTIAEFLALKKQNKKNFYLNSVYWAKDFIDKDLSGELRVVKLGILGLSWHFVGEVGDEPKQLVLIKKDTKIEGVKEEIEKLSSAYPF